MKKGFFSIRQILIATSTLIIAGALFSACKKDSNSNTDIPVAGLMAFNLSPDKTAVGIALSGNLLTNSPLSYTSYTGGYRNIYPGQRSVQSYDYAKDTTLVSASYNFEPQKYYSLFVVGNNGVYKNVIVHDDIDSLPSTHAYIRYINAIPDSSSPTVTIRANGNNVSSSPAVFSTVSGFTGVNTGDINIGIANGNTISANRTIPVENGKIYTVLFLGLPSATDSTKAVQIKYILNGTISNDDQK
jgi:hypothetical protein